MNSNFKLLFIYLTITGACINLIECLETLDPDNGVDQGDWGPVEYCGAGAYATGIEMRSDGYTTTNNGGLLGDHVGATAFRLYCGSEITGHSSLECKNNGEWLPVWHCPNQGFVVGLQLNVNPELSDSLGVENIRVLCADQLGQTAYIDAIIGNLNRSGKQAYIKYGPDIIENEPKAVDDTYWSNLLLCSGNTFVCGLQTRVAQNGVFHDNICLSDLILTCC